MLKSWLTKKGFLVETATNVKDAKQIVRENPFDLILSDIRMPETDGFSFLSWVKKYDSDILVIMMTSFADIETAVESMKSGAADYISKPIEPELLFKKIEAAFKVQANQQDSKKFFSSYSKPPGDAYVKLEKKIDELTEKNQHFLLIGERGSGKASVAQYVYDRGFDSLKPFVIFDVEQQLLQLSNLQDSEKSVLMQKAEKAKGGLLYIKKVDKFDRINQDELLSLLTKQNKDEYYTQVILGSDKSKKELEQLLLPKLYQLLEKDTVEVPPLRGQREAILFFAERFLKFANIELDKNINSIAPEVTKQLIAYSWPGNIQELKNTILKVALLTDESQIKPEILHALFKNNQLDIDSQPAELSVSGLRKENYEKEKIIEALELAKGNKTMAASILNIDRKTLYNKIKLYNVEYAN